MKTGGDMTHSDFTCFFSEFVFSKNEKKSLLPFPKYSADTKTVTSFFFVQAGWQSAKQHNAVKQQAVEHISPSQINQPHISFCMLFILIQYIIHLLQHHKRNAFIYAHMYVHSHFPPALSVCVQTTIQF